MIKLYTINVNFHPGIYLQGWRKPTKISVRVIDVLVKVGTQHLLSHVAVSDKVNHQNGVLRGTLQ
jgi:hypothetical protein